MWITNPVIDIHTLLYSVWHCMEYDSVLRRFVEEKMETHFSCFSAVLHNKSSAHDNACIKNKHSVYSMWKC